MNGAAFALGAVGALAIGATLGRRGSRNADLPSTLAFRRWFGASKVVDAEGRPLVVYHGTSRAFDRFEPKEIGKHFKHSRGGFFFLGDVEQAWGYAEGSEVEQGGTPRVISAYLSLQHPLVLTSSEEGWPESHFDDNSSSILRRARRGGHDGVIVHGIDPFSDNEPRSVYIAFRPTQIKAIDNVGTFDPADPRIHYNRIPR